MAFCSKSFPPNIQILNSDNFLAVNRPSPGVSGNSRSPPFPRMKASDSRSRIMGMFFLIPFLLLNYGNDFFSQSLPVTKLWEWILFIPFPFRNLTFHRRESKRELEDCERCQTSNIFSFLYISYNNRYNEEVK